MKKASHGVYLCEKARFIHVTFCHGWAEQCFPAVKHDVKLPRGPDATLCVNLSKSLNPQGEN